MEHESIVGSPYHEEVTYCFIDERLVLVVRRGESEHVLEEERVLDQATARDVQEIPEVQLSAEGGFDASF